MAKIRVGKKVQIIRYPGKSKRNRIGTVRSINGDSVDVQVGKVFKRTIKAYMHELKLK